MPREKNKMSHQKLEQHTIYWASDRLDELREIAQTVYLDLSIPDEEKEIIYTGLARQAGLLLELLQPYDHEEETLVEWANAFIDEYERYDDVN